jgi:hypothetical protein
VIEISGTESIVVNGNSPAVLSICRNASLDYPWMLRNDLKPGRGAGTEADMGSKNRWSNTDAATKKEDE